jgi:AcrR family transcriptional regulator
MTRCGRLPGVADEEGPGRRATHRRATRAKLLSVARELFAAKGFQATTVRDIADAAGVTERTFFRYFAVKEELIVDHVLAWVPRLRAAVLARPATEPPLTAIRRAMRDTKPMSASQPAVADLSLDRLGASASGSLQRRLEHDLTEVVTERLAAQPGGAPAGARGFRAEVLARTAVAVLRSAVIRDSELRAADTPNRPTIATLVDQAFDALPTC